MKIFLTLITTALILAISGCRLNGGEKIDLPFDPYYTDNPVILSNPKPNQQSFFLGFVSSCENFEGDFAYTGDTLKLRVFEKEEALYMIENLTPYSPLFLGGAFTESKQYTFKSENDQLILSKKGWSNLFLVMNRDTVELNPEKIMEYKEVNCKISNHSRFGIKYGGNVFFEDWKKGEIHLKNVFAAFSWHWRDQGYLFYDQNTLYLSKTVTRNGIIQGWILMN